MVCSLMNFRHPFSFRTLTGILLIVTCGLTDTVHAQVSGFDDPFKGKLAPQGGTRAVFSAVLTPATAKPGDEVTLAVTAKLPPQSYIFGYGGTFEQRTTIGIKSSVGLEPLDGDFEPDHRPKVEFDPILKQEVSKHRGDVTWSKKFRRSPDVATDKVAIDLELQGQYCSEGPGGQCTLIVPPAKLHATLTEAKPDAGASQGSSARFKFTERPIRGKINPAEFQLQLAPTKASGGKIVKLAITMVLDKDWHTFSTTFEGEGGSPTAFMLKNVYGLKPIGEAFTPNRPPEIKVVDEPGRQLRQEVYHDQVTWTQEFEVVPNQRPNAYGVELKIKYQVCDTSCIPRSADFVLGVTNDDIEPPASVAPFDEPEVAHVQGTRPQDKGLLVFLLTAVGAALVALLTPCVFPMVPITVSFFLKQNESKGGRPILLALVFSGAIVAAFVVIGVGIAAIFGATKPNELANNWILNLVLASIFFAFALNMLGMFEIQVPSWLLTLTSSGEQTGGYVGVVFMALTFVLTSFSCTFAFVGSLLAAAAQGEYYWPVLGMLAFGTTFAAPFFVLALMPGTLKSLPKSGGWLNAVKVVMGFVELAVAVKYISVVDQQWNSVPWLFDFTNVMTLWGVLSVCTGLYLLGQFRLSHDTPVQALSPARVLLAVGFLLLAGLFGMGVTQPDRETWFVNQLIAFAPARPLFIDFTGVFCTNCRLMEVRMAKPKNHRRLEKCVQVQIYTDKVPKITDEAEAARLLARNVSLQVDWFGDVTLPAYAIVTPDGKTILSSFFGLEKRDGDFAKFLDEGLAKYETLVKAQALANKR
jgi:thiol:disulfide interchange protein